MTSNSRAATITERYQNLIGLPSIDSLLVSGGRVHLATEGRALKDIQTLFQLGHRDFSEKFVQETKRKWPVALRSRVNLHGYGNLQRNKAMVACQIFSAIESVGCTNLVNKLAQFLEFGIEVPPIFLQVNIGSEPQKNGYLLKEISPAIDSAKSKGLQVRGLMCIPPRDQFASKHYRLLRSIADKESLTECSMGMSDDFEIAIAEGSTSIRVGRLIFGEKG